MYIRRLRRAGPRQRIDRPSTVSRKPAEELVGVVGLRPGTKVLSLPSVSRERRPINGIWIAIRTPSYGVITLVRIDECGRERVAQVLAPCGLGYSLQRGVFRANWRLHRARMIAKHAIDRLRARAAHYRLEAARATTRNRLIYCRALATHLENEALELERVIRSNAPREPELVSAG
jgi:hypothetical protein